MNWTKLSDSTSIHKEFVSLKGIIERRHQEGSRGIFNDDSYRLMANKTESGSMAIKSVADFIGNIKIEMIDSTKGRGIVATADIQSGELVLVERAFSFGSYREDPEGNVFVQSVNEQCGKVYSGRNQELILDTLSKCCSVEWTDFDRSHGNAVWWQSMDSVWNKWRFGLLYDGNKDTVKMQRENMMEILRNRTLLGVMNQDEIDAVRSMSISAKRVNDVITSNAFETIRPENMMHFVNEDGDESFDVIKNERFCGSGLFIVGSLFNHSSRSNAKRIMFNRHMLVRARRDIKAGDEVTISYVDQSNCDKNELQNWGIP